MKDVLNPSVVAALMEIANSLKLVALSIIAAAEERKKLIKRMSQ